MLSRVAADAVLLLHAAFIVFAVLGALAVARRPRLAWLQLPALAWAAAIEVFGWLCPLTVLENRLRQAAGEAGYRGGFIEHYLLPVVYPAGLTRSHQLVLAALLIAVNLALYAWIFRRWRRGTRP